ncbi:MAG: hypothetical protein KDD46_07070 [Bdellovibrionales bacterium]|nr:hypothetical protein [Bdellovibrionales bacterium]
MLLLLLIPASSFAKGTTDLDKAYVELLASHYKEALELTQPLLDNLTLNTIEEISLAHKILGVAKCEEGLEEASLSHFETLKTFSPNADLRGIQTSQRCQQIFDELALPKSNKKKSKSVATLPNTTTETPAQALQNQAKHKAPASRYVPFGVGQFKNGERKKGLGFLIGQTVLYSAGISALMIHASDENKALRDVGIGMLATGGFVSIWGIIDAVSTYKENQ